MLEMMFYAMCLLTALGVFAKMISGFSARSMVKAAGQIQKSNHKLMRLVRAKFEHACMVSDKVQNVEAFVDKYIYEYKILGIRIGAWQRLPKKLTLLVAAVGLFRILEIHRLEGVGTLFFDALQWTGIFTLLLFMLCFITEERSQVEAAKTYMVEYLENVCMHRYEKANRKEEEAPPEPQVEEKEPEPEEEKQAEEEQNEREMRIRAILEEFLA